MVIGNSATSKVDTASARKSTKSNGGQTDSAFQLGVKNQTDGTGQQTSGASAETSVEKLYEQIQSETVGIRSLLNKPYDKATLSDDQIAELASKYDMDNLSAKDKEMFLDDLMQMGVINGLEKAILTGAFVLLNPSVRGQRGFLTDVSGKAIFENNSLISEWSSAWSAGYSDDPMRLSKEMPFYDFLEYMFSEENRLYSEYSEQYVASDLEYMKPVMQMREKMLGVLDQIKSHQEK
jgi:hypothetical protein